MEKYARQALSEGIKNPDDLRIALDSELYRVLNLHYNRNNHIEVRIRNEYLGTLKYLTQPTSSLSFLLLLSLLTRQKAASSSLINHEAMAVTTQVGFITFSAKGHFLIWCLAPAPCRQNYITAKNINHSTATPWPILRPQPSHFALENRSHGGATLR